MTDRDALYRGILAAPADDLPRLILADFLEESGDAERPAYVRAAVELAHHVAANDFDTDRYAAAVTVVASTPVDRLWEWVIADGILTPADPGPFGRSTVGDLDRVRAAGANLTLGFRRGFVAEVVGTWSMWHRCGPGIVRTAPLETVSIIGLRPFRTRPAEWLWRRAPSGLGDARNLLPDDLFEHLPRHQSHTAGYPTVEAAAAALSAACLAWAAARPAAGSTG
ncbi:MAG: TIGR02996 domain-containing protein [Fimbriiglobus sp.]